MKKTLSSIGLTSTILTPNVLAQSSMMDRGYGMISYGILVWIIGVAVISLIFSLIFWTTYNVVVKDKKKKR